jgi:hypothetical protein
LTPTQPSAERDALLRKICFVPCTSKEQLHRWIKIFLGLDLPDCIVDPESNSSPMDMVWETYSKAYRNDDPNFNRVLYYASRDSFKTLGAAILELLVVLHLGRDVAHMAAIEAQSGKSQQYVKKFLSRPYLRDFVVGDSKETTWVLRYNNPKTGDNLTQDQYKELSEAEKNQYVEVRNYIKVVICTMAGANSEHVPFFVVDEVDVVRDPRAYEEAKMIPAPINGKMPITLLTSTRKFSFGKVQDEIDNSVTEDGETRLQIRHWNLIDVTEACPTERHLPHKTKLPIYVDDAQIRAISEKQFDALNEDEKLKYKKEEGYEGCITNCRIFAACKGRLATEQKSKSPLLRPIPHTQNQFRTVSVPTANAQLLCRKPSTEGLIYPNFDRSVHMLTPAQMAEKIMGVPFRVDLTKPELIALLKQRELQWNSGMDFGYTHNFAVVTGCVDGYRGFIVDVIAQAELEPAQKIQVCDERIKHMNPVIWADPEDPGMIAALRKAGYRMRDWFKAKGSVIGGIDIVRMRLRPTMGEPLLFFLAGDPGCELLAKRMSQYHWAIDPSTGKPSDVPDDKDDDECDALRYLVMNVFAPKGKIKAAPEHDPTSAQSTAPGVYTQENWLQKWKEENGVDVSGTTQSAGRKGGFRWNI